MQIASTSKTHRTSFTEEFLDTLRSGVQVEESIT
jgi:hypothetical protein